MSWWNAPPHTLCGDREAPVDSTGQCRGQGGDRADIVLRVGSSDDASVGASGALSEATASGGR